MHLESHPLKGKTVIIKSGKFKDHEYRLEDWWDILTGESWGDAVGNPAALDYAFRAGMENIPPDEEVVYGKIGQLGKLIHVSQLGESFEEAVSKL